MQIIYDFKKNSLDIPYISINYFYTSMLRIVLMYNGQLSAKRFCYCQAQSWSDIEMNINI